MLILLGAGLLAFIGMTGFWLYHDSTPPKQLETHLANYPIRAWGVDTSQPEPWTTFTYKVLFSLYRATWNRTENETIVRVAFQGDFDPDSEAYQRCGYAVWIHDWNSKRVLWYGHNLCLPTLAPLEQGEAVIIHSGEGSVLAKASVRILGEEKAIEFIVPDPNFQPRYVHFEYSPDEQTWKRGGSYVDVLRRIPKSPWTIKSHRVLYPGGMPIWCGKGGSSAGKGHDPR